jgi:LemA protein
VGPWVLISLFLGAAVAAAGSRSLGSLRRRVRADWDRVDSLLGRRHALVPALVEAARGALPPGGDGWESLTEARQRAADAHDVPARAEAENGLTEALGALRARAGCHADPALQASLRRLAVVEGEIAAAGQAYNLQVMAFNRRIHRYPWRLLARGLQPVEYLVLDAPVEESAHSVPS